ncbi:MAG TPA: DUF1015 domain-containing protein [Anaerolineales bacterium]|nr:DUF1015 domain-containing protein [Anaerolineales bacterium]
MKIVHSIGVQIPQVYLPRAGTDLGKWAVIACDQFTSQPEYWQQVAQMVGDAPSTLNLIFPEVYLEEPGADVRIQSIQAAMRKYLDEGLLVPHEGMVYVERTVDGKRRKGLVLALDLECYDYSKGSQSLIRATEGTIVERLPPRMRIRQGAPLESPHILVLIDDPKHTVIGPLTQNKDKLKPLYDFDLMAGSGHLTGCLVDDPALEDGVIGALEELAQPRTFASKYGVDNKQSVLLFAMGDGNHSLATAKAIWEKIKPQVGMDHPARYALVEIENVHDSGLEFEPIHRVLFGLKKDIFAEMKAYYSDAHFTYTPSKDRAAMLTTVNHSFGGSQVIGVVNAQGYGVARVAMPSFNLPVGTLQAFLDGFMKAGGAERIDYVHGEEVLCGLGAQPGNIGFYLPGMHKSDLFKTVILDGALPRKTFSMGEAHEKRFYMECRKIV